METDEITLDNEEDVMFMCFIWMCIIVVTLALMWL